MRPLHALLSALSSLLLALALGAPALGAQVGSTTDIVTGVVTGAGGAPVADAQVEVFSLDLETTRRRTTNERGQYTVLFPDGGGRYRVTVRALGFAPVTVEVARQADEDRIVANVSMTQSPVQLQQVVVQARPVPRPGAAERPEPGSLERAIIGELAMRLPIDASDLSQIAALAPGVVGIEATDSTAAGFSVAGQRPDMNQVTLDGLTFGSATVPEEAVRATRVITNTYDVSRGQFAGGQVASTTRRGTNSAQGNFSLALRDPELQWTGEDPEPVGQLYRQSQASGGFGGPIVRDRLFWFGSTQLRRRTSDLPTLLTATEQTLARLGLAPDSARRFLDELRAAGLDPVPAGLPLERDTDNLTFLGRLDYRLGDDHTLALRGDVRYGEQTGGRVSTMAVPHSGGDSRSLGGGGMLTLSSQFGNGFINELRAYVSGDGQRGTPYLLVPQGRVRIASALEDGSTGFSNLTFGGNPGAAARSDSRLLELTNELSWMSAGGAHRFKVGGLLNATESERDATSNQLGTFTFNSLADFAAGRPASFTRTLTPSTRAGGAVNLAGYAGDTWRVSDALQLNYGLRLEGTRFSGDPRANPAVRELFGVSTAHLPTELRASPRVGFSYVVQGADGRRGPPRLVVRGGVGEFRGRVAESLVTAALEAHGLPGGQTQLVCTGAAVPAPAWDVYLADPSAIPAACADGSVGAPTITSLPTVTVLGHDFAAPASWRASLGATRQLAQRFGLSVDATWSRGVRLTGATDLNLRDAPVFTLGGEGGRPVYADPAAITPQTGAVSLRGSRLHPEFGQVLRLGSDLESETAQVTVGLNGFTMRGLQFNVAYTFQRSRDQGAAGGGGGFRGGGGFGGFGGFGGILTAGDPHVREWGTSDLERRHSLVGTANWPVRPWAELTVVSRLGSGQPYTPLVGGDVNGDGARNDRAFVFDPAAAPDTAVANGMQRLLDRSSDRTRDCLLGQLGRIAARNSCATGWYPSLDLQLNLRPTLAGLDRRLTLQVAFVNPLGGLDQLLHGSDGLRGWGQPARPDATLLEVRGFDPAAQRFLYAVNERFGDDARARTALRNPFLLALTARWSVGRDPARERMAAIFGGRGGRGGPGGGGGPGGLGPAGAGDLRGRLANLVPNPFDSILVRREALLLEAAQVARLTVLSDSLKAHNAALAAELEQGLGQARGGGEPGALMAQMRQRFDAARATLDAALRDAQAVLTAEQWAKLPEHVRSPPAGPAAPGGRGRRPE